MAELFDDFEINSTPRWPRLSRLVALSVVLHGLLILAVVYVPTLRAVARAAGSVAGIEFVEEDYTKTVIGQRATIVKLEPYEKLYYPADYFSPGEVPVAPEASVVSEAATAQAPPPPPADFFGRRRSPRARTLPTPEPTPDELADADAADATTPGDDADAKPEEPPKPDAEIDKVAAENKTPRLPKINTKPFTDLLATGKKMVDEKRLNLDGGVELTVEADRNPDGTLGNIKIGGTADNESLNKLAEDFVAALSDSKLFMALPDIEHMTMSLKLDKETLSVNVASDVKSAARAKEMETGYGAMVGLARLKKGDSDDGELWKGVKISSQEEKFIMDFKMTREAAAGLLAKQIAKQQQQQQQQQEAPKETPR